MPIAPRQQSCLPSDCNGSETSGGPFPKAISASSLLVVDGQYRMIREGFGNRKLENGGWAAEPHTSAKKDVLLASLPCPDGNEVFTTRSLDAKMDCKDLI